jgi:hypothetical protein
MLRNPIIEEKMGLKVVSSDNFLGLKAGDKTDALE